MWRALGCGTYEPILHQTGFLSPISKRERRCRMEDEGDAIARWNEKGAKGKKESW